MPNILLVEDDTALAELIASYLERNGYHVSVISRGDHVRERARLNPPDLVILDLMLPGLDGLQVCRLLRADSASLPILMLTARDDSHDQVLGLEMGADDYVTKPCEPASCWRGCARCCAAAACPNHRWPTTGSSWATCASTCPSAR
jgi:two-component system OmpR family response regulator